MVVCRKQDCGEGCCAPACRCLCQRILEFAQRAWRRSRAGPGHLPGSFDRTLQPGEGFRKHSSTAVGRPAGPRDCDAAPRSADGRYDRILRRKSNPMPTSLFFTVGGEEVFRTIYPSIARDQSCVDCHNKIQPQQSWKLNDVMGAFAIDAPVGPFLRLLGFESVCFGIAIFMLIGGVGLLLSISHYPMSRAEIVG